MFEEKLEKIKQKALEEHIPIIMDDTLLEIEKILKESNNKTMLEIGAAVGYSAICFSKYIEEKIDTIELDEQKYLEANKNIKEIGLTSKINVMLGDAVEILPTLTEKYDIVFIDASKSKYPIFLEQALRLTTEKGIIVADNVLYKGYVLSDYNKHKQRTAVRNLREFLKKCEENKNIEFKLLEVGDGLAIIRKNH